MPLLGAILKSEPDSEVETLRTAQQVLMLLTSSGGDPRVVVADRNSPYFVNQQLFVGDTANIRTLIERLSSTDYYVRFNTTQLLAVLLANHTEIVQRCVAHDCPMGVPLVTVVIMFCGVIFLEKLIYIMLLFCIHTCVFVRVFLVNEYAKRCSRNDSQ